ncbi:MAG TPA: hypothetical protein VKY24_19000 [Reyranella sp.]|nr:hypothetical protein [Reyranella sp.]
MRLTTSIRPAYSQVVICDPTAKVEVPLWERGVPFVASDTCILFMCYPEIDGPTGITFGDGDDVQVHGDPICERMLKTPGRQIAVETAEGDGIFSMPTTGTETKVRIWSNRSWLPDKVIIGVD